MLKSTTTTSLEWHQRVLTDCVTLLQHFQAQVGANRLQCEEILLEDYIQSQNPSQSSDGRCLTVISLFRAYLRHRHFLAATLLHLFPSTPLPARQHILLGLLLVLLLFRPNETQLSDPLTPTESQIPLDLRWIEATARVVTSSLPNRNHQLGQSVSVLAVHCISHIVMHVLAEVEQLAEGGDVVSAMTSRQSTASVPIWARSELLKGSAKSAGQASSPEQRCVLEHIPGLMAAWAQVLDGDHVKQVLLGPLVPVRLSLEAVLGDLNQQITQPKRKAAKKTVPLPFELTLPRPRKVFVPEAVDSIPKARPIPASHYNPIPETVRRHERQKELNRELLKKTLREASDHQFAIVERTSTSMQRKKEQQASRETESLKEVKDAQLNVKPKRSVGPLRLDRPKPVRLTAAAILREEALVRRQLDKERKRLEEDLTVAAAGTMSNRELEARKAEMQIIQEEEDRLYHEEMRMLVHLSKEEALAARHQSLNEKRHLVKEMKQESKTLKQKKIQQTQQESKHKIKVVESVQASRESVREVKEKLQEDNRQRALEIEQQKQQMRMQRLKEEEAERLQRMELIRQIRAMEITAAAAAQDKSPKKMDMTEISGFGLLGEMSILELQERLSLLRVHESEEEAAKRARIVALKQKKSDELRAKMERVHMYRQAEKSRDQERARSQQASQASLEAWRVDGSRQGLYGTKKGVEKLLNKSQAVQMLQAKLEGLREKRGIVREEERADRSSSSTPLKHKVGFALSQKANPCEDAMLMTSAFGSNDVTLDILKIADL